MARPGVTYQDIAAAANELKGQGRSVTIANVRAVLGTGSIGTINNYLRKWKDAQQSTNKIATKENIPEELIALVKGLWERVCAQSTEQFTPIEKIYQREITELKQEVEKYKTNNQRWQKLYGQWLAEKNAFAQEKLTLEQALDFARSENVSLHTKYDGLIQQLQDKQEYIAELHRLHNQAQENLEHYRESAREQRLLDQQQFEGQKQQLQAEIKTLNKQLVMQREKELSLQQMQQSLQQAYAALDKNQAETQSKYQQLVIKFQETEQANNEHKQASSHWQKQYVDLQKIIEEKTSLLIDTQAEIKLLSQQVTDAKQAYAMIQDQNKLLNHEKWIIAQEKAQLEGQLKQMQKMVQV